MPERKRKRRPAVVRAWGLYEKGVLVDVSTDYKPKNPSNTDWKVKQVEIREVLDA